MSKGLKYGVGVIITTGCLLALSVAVGSRGHSSAAADSTKSITSSSAELNVGKTAPATDLAGRRYRRYWRRHTV